MVPNGNNNLQNLPGVKFTYEEEQYLVWLKECQKPELNWEEITIRFNRKFPGSPRTKGGLQVHYSRSLKPGASRRPRAVNREGGETSAVASESSQQIPHPGVKNARDEDNAEDATAPALKKRVHCSDLIAPTDLSSKFFQDVQGMSGNRRTRSGKVKPENLPNLFENVLDKIPELAQNTNGGNATLFPTSTAKEVEPVQQVEAGKPKKPNPVSTEKESAKQKKRKKTSRGKKKGGHKVANSASNQSNQVSQQVDASTSSTEEATGIPQVVASTSSTEGATGTPHVGASTSSTERATGTAVNDTGNGQANASNQHAKAVKNPWVVCTQGYIPWEKIRLESDTPNYFKYPPPGRVVIHSCRAGSFGLRAVRPGDPPREETSGGPLLDHLRDEDEPSDADAPGDDAAKDSNESPPDDAAKDSNESPPDDSNTDSELSSPPESQTGIVEESEAPIPSIAEASEAPIQSIAEESETPIPSIERRDRPRRVVDRSLAKYFAHESHTFPKPRGYLTYEDGYLTGLEQRRREGNYLDRCAERQGLPETAEEFYAQNPVGKNRPLPRLHPSNKESYLLEPTPGHRFTSILDTRFGWVPYSEACKYMPDEILDKDLRLTGPSALDFPPKSSKGQSSRNSSVIAVSGVENETNAHVTAVSAVENETDAHITATNAVENGVNVHVTASNVVENGTDAHVTAANAVENGTTAHVTAANAVENGTNGHVTAANAVESETNANATAVGAVVNQTDAHVTAVNAVENGINAQSTAPLPTEQVGEGVQNKGKKGGEKAPVASTMTRPVRQGRMVAGTVRTPGALTAEDLWNLAHYSPPGGDGLEPPTAEDVRRRFSKRHPSRWKVNKNT